MGSRRWHWGHRVTWTASRSPERAGVGGGAGRQRPTGREGTQDEGPGCGASQWWWLRSPGNNDNNAAAVAPDGRLNRNGNNVNNTDVGARPDSSHSRSRGGSSAVPRGVWPGRSTHVGTSAHGTKEPGSWPSVGPVGRSGRTQAGGDEDGPGCGYSRCSGSSPSAVGGRPETHPPRQ